MNGYCGKLLFVDLTNGTHEVEDLTEETAKQYIGGYGIGAKVLFERMKPGSDPLGPDNTLGLVTGLLTGVPVPGGCRYTVVAKSPLTGGWGDANSGGDFGPNLKFSGYDAIFLTGVSEKLAYLVVRDGQAELRDADHLWGKDTCQTEDISYVSGICQEQFRLKGKSITVATGHL